MKNAFMSPTKAALAIVDRSFRHDTPIREGLLQLAELAKESGTVCVITQTVPI